MMARLPRPTSEPPLPADAAALAAPQLDLFPTQPETERLDPRTVLGPRTAVAGVVRVRLLPNGPVHLVFHDRHGWYCELHGRACPAVAVARTQGAA